ncbi:MAG: potassium-transporting ATPase subunit KdpC [Nakamurella sp.]
MSPLRAGIRTAGTGLRTMLVLTAVLGIAYPLVITGVGEAAFPWHSNGLVVEVNGMPVGSALIGQSFSDANGNPLPEYFQPRPSAAGKGYDGAASGGSNLGPENPDLIALIKKRRAEIAEFDDVDPKEIPADALTASASGLDPDISPAYALLQVSRIAKERGLLEPQVRELVTSKIRPRDLGYLGEPSVNVLELNIALTQLKG